MQKPKLTLALDASQINTFLECPQMYFLNYQRHLRKRGLKQEAYDKGTIFHEILRYYYTKVWEGAKEDQAMECTVSNLKLILDKASVNVPKEDSTFLLTRFISYHEFYKNDLFKICTIKKDNKEEPAIEVGFSIPLLRNDTFFFILEGRVDLMVVNKQDFKLWIDHKTQSKKYEIYKSRPQFLTYSLATESKGIINYIGLTNEVNKETFRRSAISPSTHELQMWKDKILRVFYSIAYDLLNYNLFEKNESMCEGKYGYPCQFTMLCEEPKEVKEELIQVHYEKVEEWRAW